MRKGDSVSDEKERAKRKKKSETNRDKLWRTFFVKPNTRHEKTKKAEELGEGENDGTYSHKKENEK